MQMSENDFGPYVRKIGNKYYPQGRPVVHSENLWRERTWEVRRESGGRCVFEQMSGAHGGGVVLYEISEQEFEAVKKSEISFEDLVRITDHNPQRKPL